MVILLKSNALNASCVCGHKKRLRSVAMEDLNVVDVNVCVRVTCVGLETNRRLATDATN